MVAARKWLEADIAFEREFRLRAAGPHFGDRVYLSVDEFEALRVFPAVINAGIAPYQAYKVRLYDDKGRLCWHQCERQYQYGIPVYFANEIIIRLKADDQRLGLTSNNRFRFLSDGD